MDYNQEILEGLPSITLWVWVTCPFKQAHLDLEECSKGLQVFLVHRSLFMGKKSSYMFPIMGNHVIQDTSQKRFCPPDLLSLLHKGIRGISEVKRFPSN